MKQFSAPPRRFRRGYPLMAGPKKKRRVFAQFESVCAACGRRHIRVGDEIQHDEAGHGWAAPRCLSRRDSPTAIDRSVQRLMLSLHKTALGTWGIPDGVTPTRSYAEFYGLALAKGCCTQHEVDVMRGKVGDVWTMENL